MVLDLEDGVAETQKPAARDLLRGLQDQIREQEGCEIGIRISSLGTPDGLQDMLRLQELTHLPDWVFLPKCESPRDLEQLDHLLQAHPSKEMTRICALLETPAGLSNAEAIASTCTAARLGFWLCGLYGGDGRYHGVEQPCLATWTAAECGGSEPSLGD